MNLNIFSSLKSRIFALVVTLTLSVLAISLSIFYQKIIELESKRFQTELNNASDRVSSFLDTRIQEFRKVQNSINNRIIDGQVFVEFADEKSTLDSFLITLFRDTRAEMIMLMDPNGMILTQRLIVPRDGSSGGRQVVDGSEIGTAINNNLMPDSNQTSDSSLVYSVDGKYYQFIITEVERGETQGFVAYGFEISEALAEFLYEDHTDNKHVNFILVNASNPSDCQLIASSKPDIQMAFSEGLEVSCDTASGEFLMADNNVIVGELGQYQIQGIVYGALESLIANLDETTEFLLILISLILLASILAVYFIASIISKPVQKLADKAKIIAAGNYNEPVEINDSGELGQLASEFNLMQQAVLNREQAIRHQAAHDPLTDLPNRNRLFEKLQEWHDTEERDHGMLLIKVDHIKEINESLGHETGDQVIQFVADRLRTLDGLELLSHLRADEFVLLVRAHSRTAILEWVDLVTKLMEFPCSTKGMTLHLSVHIGIALDFDKKYMPGHFLRMADSALQMARKTKVPFKLYDPSLDQEQTERLELMNELRTAIEANELLLHYQPKLNPLTNKVDKVEALVRWQHPERGMVRPDKFISIAENSGQINALTNWVLEEAARQHNAWLEHGMDISIAVNISAENLKNESFYDSILFLLEQYNLDKSAINLEVTESAVVEDPESAIELLARLKQKGFHLSIDDYGTGYSSLAQLKQLPVDELKIDMSFIKRLPDDEDDKIIVKSTIELAHNMGLTVVAEGVETEQGLQWLTDNDCDLMQGYFISKPIAGDEFAQWYQSSSYSK